ncbi:MAG: DUF4388 domain-containing protein [candidate division Zixibacteria bacterium]|jgi:hypothetical protein|nr:DUF4388 domain-containing protein [candidate division Zixibacteria bacterium]
MSLSGNLKTVSFPDILQLLATGKKTGILECKTSTRQKEVAFRDGNIIFASSVNSTEDLLGNMLLKRGKISKGDLERAITLHKQTGRQLGTTLVDMNLFSKEEVGECLKLQIEEIVYNLFSWREGDFIFHENTTPKNAPFLIELNTMNVIMEGTRRIDEWMEIQKVLPPDDVVLRINTNPKTKRDELTISMEEFRLLSLINGERTVPDLIDLSPVGEFVTCRAIYRLIVQGLIESAGKREGKTEQKEDEEEVVLALIFRLYNHCFYRVRTLVEDIVGPDNTRFPSFSSQYRTGILTFFPGVDPESDLMPSLDRFLSAVRAIPPSLRFHTLMSSLERMLSEQLVYVYQLLGHGVFRETINAVKKEIAEPLATRRELVKRYGVDENFYGILKRADKTVKLVRG